MVGTAAGESISRWHLSTHPLRCGKFDGWNGQFEIAAAQMCCYIKSMRKALLLIFLFLCSCTLTSHAQAPRFATLELSPVRVTNATVTWSGSNSFAIAAGETAEILNFIQRGEDSSDLILIRQGVEFPFNYLAGTYWPIFVQGPALLVLRAVPDWCISCSTKPSSFVTLRIHPDVFPPDRTLVIGPDTKQVLVALECSTNLLDWATATNGNYGSTNDAKFFRIKALRGP